MLRITMLIGVLAFAAALHAQINAYAQITSIEGDTCYVGSKFEGASQFAIGKHVVIMQMQDDVIGENITNTANFGDLGHIGTAGKFVVREIVDLLREDLSLTGVVLDRSPGIVFQFGPNSSVQMITYERLGDGGDFTTTANIGARIWDGTIGGVVAFYVEGTLDLQHNIFANSAGFRGGDRTLATAGACEETEYIHEGANSAAYAKKGEGIYKLDQPQWNSARGHLITGGGGGNGHNAGGGGGSNYTSGGTGGAGLGCTSTPSGGIGGVGMSGYVNGLRVFMGGGGGGGQGDNNSASVGMRGGGIIMIKADVIKTTGSCGGRSISANGASANSSGGDGAGGGGAGGTILLDVDWFDISAGCPLTIRANGGNGGDVVHTDEHGGGGGGGQGALLFRGMVPITNVITEANNGIGGCNSIACTTRAGSGGGSNGAGINYFDASPLPVQLITFEAHPKGSAVDLFWSTATEQESEMFIIERSVDGSAWEPIVRAPAAGSSSIRQDYLATDASPLPGTSFYRLVQISLTGVSDHSHIVSVEMKNGGNDPLLLFPNPARGTVNIVVQDDLKPTTVRICNELGQLAMPPLRLDHISTEVDISGLYPGFYVVMMNDGPRSAVRRLVVH